MCGRFSYTPMDADAIAAGLGVPVESLKFTRPRYNIAPTDEHFVVRMRHEERQVLPARWGLVNSWAKDAREAARQINARGETLEARPAFREAFAKRRCIVPSDGFFEWTGPKEARQPVWFHRPDGGLVLMAGLYEFWRPNPDAEWQASFTIVTTNANELVTPIHDRMPVILLDDQADAWMDPREEDTKLLHHLLAPAPNDFLVVRPVSPRLNSVKNDSADLLVETPRLL